MPEHRDRPPWAGDVRNTCDDNVMPGAALLNMHPLRKSIRLDHSIAARSEKNIRQVVAYHPVIPESIDVHHEAVRLFFGEEKIELHELDEGFFL